MQKGRYSSFEIAYAGLTSVGLVREHNEDTWAALPEERLFLLADGMGGHAGGEIASHEAIQILGNLLKTWRPAGDITIEKAIAFFYEAFQKTNESIFLRGQSELGLQGMGTTLSFLYILKPYAIIGHVGDSRIYRFRNSQLTQLTEDHSLIAEMIHMGAMTSDEAQNFPYKHILTRALGTQSTVEPTLNYLSLVSKDRYLLCSDGLSNYVSEEEIAAIMKEEDPLPLQCQRLIDTANQHGGGDNITALIIELPHDIS